MNDNRENESHGGHQAPQSVAEQLAEMFGPVIHTATRAELLAEGQLIPAPDKDVRQAGLLIPVAFTAAAWADAVEWSEATDTAKGVFTGQDQTGRLWDVLYVTAHAMRATATRPPSWCSCTACRPPALTSRPS